MLGVWPIGWVQGYINIYACMYKKKYVHNGVLLIHVWGLHGAHAWEEINQTSADGTQKYLHVL